MATYLLSIERAIAETPLEPFDNLNRATLDPVEEFQTNATGADPSCPVATRVLSVEIERAVMSLVWC
jgi:hypothetical protein